MKLFINFIVFQIGWFALVFGGAHDLPWLGTGLAFAIVGLHLLQAERPGIEWKLILLVTAVGALWESLMVGTGLLRYPSGMLVSGLAPYWIVALWMLFATALNISFRWLKGRYGLAAVLGAIFGPMAFYSGSKLGGVEFSELQTGLLALSLGWAVLMPAVMALSNRYDGIAVIQQTQQEQVGLLDCGPEELAGEARV